MIFFLYLTHAQQWPPKQAGTTLVNAVPNQYFIFQLRNETKKHLDSG
jgi:hypothetical protein